MKGPALLLVLVAVFACGENLEFKKVNFVAHSNITGNWLFRGNEPLIDEVFAYDTLVEYLKERAQSQAGYPLPDNFYLVDISFLSELLPSEDKDLNVERNFFKKNSSLGELIHWPLMGDLTSPEAYPEIVRKEMAEHLEDWQVDELVPRLSKVHEMLETKGNSSVPLVIYFHCEAGTDRTGEFAGSYYMQYWNITFKAAMAIDERIGGRDIGTTEKWATEWYCYYLKYKLGFSEAVCY